MDTSGDTGRVEKSVNMTEDVYKELYNVFRFYTTIFIVYHFNRSM